MTYARKVAFGLTLLACGCAVPGLKAEPACSDLRPYVYRIRLSESRTAKRPAAFGSGFFLSADGLFVTALHVLEEAPDASHAVVEVNDSSRWFDCGAVAVTSYSRKLDFVVLRVRLGSARVKVPQVASVVRAGDRVTGFRVGPPLAKGFKSSLGIACSTGVVSAISPQEIGIKGEVFFVPGSSGSPVFDAGGRVVGIAMEMANSNPEGSRPQWTYTSLPVADALSEPKLPARLSLGAFLSALRQSAGTSSTLEP